jgi:hypothetical protein
VSQWTQSPTQDLSEEHRGWVKGRCRVYDQEDEALVRKLYAQMQADEGQYFFGPHALSVRYQSEYPGRKELSLPFLIRIYSQYEFSTKPKAKRKGGARYLHYPETLLATWFQPLLEIDFIGKKFIRGETDPLNFLAFSIKKAPKFKYFDPIPAETSEATLHSCRRFFDRFGKPHAAKFDNGFPFAGTSGRSKRCLSRVPLFCLRETVIPIFTAPRKPWNQASVEGSNSVFSRTFWLRHEFNSREDVFLRLERFNANYQQYCQFPGKLPPPHTPWAPKVYFLRKVYEAPEKLSGCIEVARDTVLLPEAFINLFVLAEWDLAEQQLAVYFQDDDQQPVLIEKVPFSLNPATARKCKGFI